MIRDTACIYVLLHDGWHKVDAKPHYLPESVEDEDDWFGQSIFLAKPLSRDEFARAIREGMSEAWANASSAAVTTEKGD